jgi:copper transport protein
MQAIRHLRSGGRWLLLGGAVLALTVVLALPGAGPAAAHAIVRSTEPRIDQVVAEAPAAVTMTFNEPVEITFGAIRVFDTRGRRVDAGETEHLPGRPDSIAVPLRPQLADGTYTVTWRVVSADGHPIEEAFVFHVGAPGRNPLGVADRVLGGQSGAGPVEGALAGVGRWFGFVSMLVMAGAAVFLVVAWRIRSEERPPEVLRRFSRRWRRITEVSWAGALVATLVLYVLQGAVAADLPLGEAISADVMGKLAGTRFGIVSLARLGLLVLLAAMWPAVRRRVEPRESVGAAARVAGLPRSVLVVAGIALVGVLATPGLAGHAGTTPPLAANIASDTMHVVGAAVWLGGLLLLVAGAFPATRGLAEDRRAAVLAPVVSRFSDMAMIAVAALVASGFFRAWMEVRAWRALTGATYGVTLLVKLGVFAPLLALGAVNNRWVKPRITRAVDEGRPRSAPLGTLRRLVGAEVALATVVVGITAFLVNLPPARIEAGVTGPFITDVRLGENNLNVLVDPNRVGANEVHLTVTEPTGAPAPIEEMRVLFRMPSEGIGPLVGEATMLAEGHFVVQGNQLSVAGEWELQVVARISEFEEERTSVTVSVNP